MKNQWPMRTIVSSNVVPFRAFLCVGMFLLAAAARAGERVGDIDVNVQPLPSREVRSGTASYSGNQGTTHGYVEFRVQLKNVSSKDQTVHLRYPGDDPYGRVNRGVVVSRTVRVAGGQEAAVSLYQPPVQVANHSLGVRIDGVKNGLLMPLISLYEGGYGYGRYYSGSPEKVRPVVLLSRSVPQDFKERGKSKSGSASLTESASAATGSPAPGPEDPSAAAPELFSGSSTGAGGTATPEPDPFQFLRSELPVSQWSHNWLGYSCYDAILLTERDAAEMPSAVQLAVRRYLECGGTLLVHGQNVPAVFSQGGVADDKGGHIVGLGYAAASLPSGESDWDATYKKLASAPIHVYQADRRPDNLYDLLVKEATVPVRGLFVLVLLFTVGIGPANVWLLSKFKRRIWLWWNVPAISLLTCLAVFTYASFSEGWTGHGKIASLTLLDERVHRATTFGYLSYYCPLTPSAGPRFGVDTDVALLSNQSHDWRSYYREDSHLRFVDWTGDQHLAAGWVTARVPAYFQFRKNEDRRQRLKVEKQADGSLKVVNALGADIRRLYVADASGRIFEGRDIPAGAENTLAGMSGDKTTGAGGGQAELRRMFTSPDWLGAFHDWATGAATTFSLNPALGLAPGSYVALLSKSPFVEAPLGGVISEHTVAIVYGISKGPDDGR